tara:strand:+ start:1116 stop:2036 length:921 start_codon:yes stop_codon:yes gene_type:complete
MSFSKMKKSTGNTSNLMDELNKISSGDKKDYNDDRFWKPTRDKSDNGYAVIRFLPPVDGEDVPWVRIFNHGFKGKGGWLIDNCPTTIGKKCPVCEANSALWNSGHESDKDIARNRKRRLQYISNIVVVEDSKNPDAEGNVFLYKFGKKIFDKIQEVLQPEFEDEDPMNPFDFWKGANFKIKIRKVGGFVNYDKSEFTTPTAFADGDDEALEIIWKKQYKLQEFIGDDQFKSYDELKSRMDMVLGGRGAASSAAEVATERTRTEPTSEDAESAFGEPKKEETTTTSDSGSEEGEDALAYFERLANED